MNVIGTFWGATTRELIDSVYKNESKNNGILNRQPLGYIKKQRNLLFILVLFETRDIYLTKEVYFSQFTEKWYDVTDYEMLCADKKYNELLGPLFFFNSKYCASSIYM